MGQIVSPTETSNAHDRAGQQHLYNNYNQAWAQQSWQQNYGADRLDFGPLGTGYSIPQPRAGNGQITINMPQDRQSKRCATAVAVGSGAGFVGGAAAGSAFGNIYCPQIPNPVGQGVCRAASSLLGGAAGAYEGGMKGYNSPFCKDNR